ncbi:hypothetical protein [Nocardioides pacificus]
MDDKTPVDLELEHIRRQQITQHSRHTQALTSLMDNRQDLRGVYAMADLVDDFVRWSA